MAKEEKKRSGYNGKILHVDLTAHKTEIEEPAEAFYRTYLGGGLLGTYYLLKGTKPGVDPLSPDNVLVFAPSVATGAAVSGVSRFNVTAASPLTGAVGDTQCGGDWAAKLKHAGFDAVVVKGKAKTPVYLWIDQGKAEIKDASSLWGRVTGEAQELIRQELGDEKIEVVQIGPGGENLVRYACVTGGLSHFGGRTGMGAVMGSKNLKAIAVRGKRAYAFHDENGVKKMAKKGAAAFKESEMHQSFQKYGTAMTVEYLKGLGHIVTRNFQSSEFELTDEINGQKLSETFLTGNETCYSCVIRCKRVVEADEPFRIEGIYGGPEYETLGMLGSNLGIGDLAIICKANEICNKNTLDTVSAGGMIAFAMECFERGIITQKETGGLDLRFGDGEAALKLLEMIVSRQGVGDILADGYPRAIAEWGEGCRELAMQVKDQPFPAHMPRIKPSQGLMYAVNPFGADHMSSEHDWIAAAEGDITRGLGITDFTENTEGLDAIKVRAVMLSQFFYSLLDTLTLCDFCWGPGALFSYSDIPEFIRAVTGWQASFFELMKAGERRINLMRAFNARQGFSREQDKLPARMFEPLPTGKSKGKKLDPDRLKEALSEYYAMMNWDVETGNPTKGKLMELGLTWVAEAQQIQ